jgi:hypothetical protein
LWKKIIELFSINILESQDEWMERRNCEENATQLSFWLERIMLEFRHIRAIYDE